MRKVKYTQTGHGEEIRSFVECIFLGAQIFAGEIFPNAPKNWTERWSDARTVDGFKNSRFEHGNRTYITCASKTHERFLLSQLTLSDCLFVSPLIHGQ